MSNKVLKAMFSETTYACILTDQILSFYHNSNEFQKRGGWQGGGGGRESNFRSNPQPQNELQKNPP